ncbi:MAG: hypothetical protein A4E35_00783 [Methanoregula sp. PtaU1.Bin051]|nr:MAG: hypothetical protein A4E35_00783 [Methanoregula sp. PtaU1.Bin051]
MAPRRRSTPPPDKPRPRGGAATSRDKARRSEDLRHHPEGRTRPRPAHRIRKKPTGLTKHHPHTTPEEYTLDIDHGTHEDRPRPGKLAKKGRHKGA